MKAIYYVNTPGNTSFEEKAGRKPNENSEIPR